jgi:hypothetical protein
VKYFTPERLVRLRTTDEAAYEEAAADWDAVRDAYWKRNRRIRKQLMAGQVDQLEAYSLHDARVLSLGYQLKKPLVTMRVQLEGSTEGPGTALEIQYETVRGPAGGFTIEERPELAEALDYPVILNNEFDYDADNGFLTHSILLTGLEYTFRFHKVRVRLLDEPELPVRRVPAEVYWSLAESALAGSEAI